MTAAVVSALHVLFVATALGAIFLRGRALRGPLDDAAFRRLFAADNAWGVAAAGLLATGLARAFAGLEKGSAFYLASHLFWTKMTLFVIVAGLEAWPMVTFIRWRSARRRGAPPAGRLGALYVVNHVELALLVLIVFAAAFMARGFGVR